MGSRANVPRMREALYKLVGKRIADSRERAKLTQTELAERVGLSRPSIANVEQGRQAIPLHKLCEIATAIGVNAAELIPSEVQSPSAPAYEGRVANLAPADAQFVSRVLSKTNR